MKDKNREQNNTYFCSHKGNKPFHIASIKTLAYDYITIFNIVKLPFIYIEDCL